MGTSLFRVAVLAAVTAGWLGGASAWGAALTAESYDSAVEKGHRQGKETRWGRGWHPVKGGDAAGQEVDLLRYPAAGSINPASGTVELDIVRDNGAENLETYFTLVGEDGGMNLTARIWWKGRGPYAGPVLEITSRSADDSLWYREERIAGEKRKRTRYPLPKSIAVGQRFHLAFTWGASAGEANIYLDGRRLSVQKDEPFGMSSIIERSTGIVVGGQPARGGRAYAQPGSVIKSVHIYDAALGGELYANPAQYRPSALALAVSTLDHDGARVAGFSGRLVAGDTMTVTAAATPGVEASFDVARLADIRGEITVGWAGYGVYLEEKTFFDEGEVNLRDVDEYRVYAGTAPLGPVTEETPYVESLEVQEQSYTFEALESGTPYYVAVVARMEDGSLVPVIWPDQDLPMAEVEGAPGTYEGTFTVDYGDIYAEAVIVGRLGRGDEALVQVGDESFQIDPSLTLQVLASPGELKADEKSTSEVKVTVTDANGEPVSNHEVRFVLATTSQYTGVVGGGTFADEVGGSLSRDFWGETDLFGQVTATYTAGFAAKTAIIVARDMQSNDTGAGYVKTYINAAAELELEAVQQTAGKALGYSITVTSSDEWLTADGESEARITALVSKDGIPVEGHRVGFTVSAGSGSIRTIQGVTDDRGRARAVYTAGRKIGMVLITATDHTAQITGTVQIELRSDAPAKIAVTVDPEVLPADGRSTADVQVTVTDINDNPNEGVEVEYAIVIGTGRLRRVDEITDRRGESTAQYVAGRMPGTVSIGVTVRSTVPAEEEMLAARALATAVTDYDFY